MRQAIDMNLQIVKTSNLTLFGGLQYGVAVRELGLDAASAGLFIARRVKVAGPQPAESFASEPDAWLSFLYIVEGTLTLRIDGCSIELQAHDAVSQVLISAASVVGMSPALEFFELQARDVPGIRELMPQRPAQIVSRDAPGLHVIGQGPREFFDYRDLGLAGTTNGQVEVQIIRARRARQGGTGWHSHTMAQLSYGLSGWASLGVEGRDTAFIQEPGDSLCIPPECVHNADSFSQDYWALQLQIPAEYETRARATPQMLQA